MPSQNNKKNSFHTKKQRELILTISLFLLNQEVLKKLFWNVTSANYVPSEQVVKIGITTTNGKYGTTLTKLRKTSRTLSDYLFENGLTFRRSKIVFFVEKEQQDLDRVYQLLDSIAQM